MASTFFFSDSPSTVTSTNVVINSASYNNRSSTLTSAQLGNEVTSIADGAFSGCTSITSIVIPNSVTYLGDAAFDGCTNLSSVTIGTGVTGFSYLLFQNCTSLINLTVPSNILIINPESFYGCSNLINININSNNPNYTSVDGVVFNKNITTLVLYPIGKIGSYSIPNTVTTIAFESFLNCTNLTNITIPNSVTNITTYSLVGCTGLISLIIPNSVTSIGDYAFLNCTNLTRVTISNSVTSINLGTFTGCTNLNNITIPKNVTTIGNQVFSNCTSLTRVNFLGNAPSLGTNVFLNTNVNLKVYRYSTKSGWSSTFGGKDVLLIDAPSKGLKTFGFVSNSSGQASVKKTNIGRGRLTLSKFDPRNISNIALWTTQGGLDYSDNYSIIYLEFYVGADHNIDTVYYPDDNTFRSYTGAQFGFTITYDESVGLWYLNDPNIEADIAYSENLLAGEWVVYGSGLEYFELSNYDYDSFTSTGDTLVFIWSDISGKNNHLLTRPFPRNNGIGTFSNIFSNLETKHLNTPFRTSGYINLLNPFTIYMVLLDTYTGIDTRRILGMQGRDQSIIYSNLYLESTSSPFNHIFSLKYFNMIVQFPTQTAFSVNVNKAAFASSTYAPSILKLSSNYLTTSAAPERTMSLTYYNLYKNVNPTIGSVSGTGTIVINGSALPSICKLFIGNDSYGKTVDWGMDLGEVLIYDKFLNNTEDGSINRYLQRKYYGKLLS